MSYNGPDPFPVHTGGTGANTLTGVLTGNGTSAITGHAVTQHSLLLAGASNVVDSLGVATNGQIPIGSTGADPVLATLTSSGSTITITNGAGSINLEVAGGGAIDTIDGDTGSATGSTIHFNANSNSGSSVLFAASGSTVDLKVTDSNNNTILGSGSGNGSISGSHNMGFGQGTMATLSSGHDNIAMGSLALANASTSNFNVAIGTSALTALTTAAVTNTAIGYSSLDNLLTGSYNIAIGPSGGTSYTSSESSNILISNSGTISESNVIRIGTQGSSSGEQNECFIAGIVGVTVSNTEFVTINSSTGQLGVSSGSPLITIDGDTGSATGSTITFNANSNCGSSVLFSASGSTVDLKVTDANGNIIIGSGSGNGTISGDANIILGSGAGTSLSSGGFNILLGTGASITIGQHNQLIGSGSYASLTSGSQNCTLGLDSGGTSNGSYNLLLGDHAGSLYTGTESSNIILSNAGVLGESNAIHIGTQGSGNQQQNTCFIAGITGVATTNSQYVTINSSTGQLGASAGPIVTPVTTVLNAASPYTVLAADQFISADVTGGVITIKLPNAPTTGRVITIKDKAGLAATSNISVTTVGGTVTIDGATTYTMASTYQSIQVIFDGTNYEVF